jgi:hypothetical protein
MLAAADVGQSVVAGVLGLGAAGVAGGIIAMAWNLHLHQLQIAERLAGRFAGREAAGHADIVEPAHAANGNGGSPKVATGVGAAARAAGGAAVPAGPDSPDSPGTPGTPGTPAARAARAGRARSASPPPPSAIEGPDSVVIGEQARYRVLRTAAQQVVAWTAGGGAVSQASDPACPDDLLLVADRPGNLTVSVRLREGLSERRETKTVTAVPNPETVAPAVGSRLFLQDWPLITVAVLVVGFTAALAALGSLPVGDFIALVAPLTALLAIVATTRKTSG